MKKTIVIITCLFSLSTLAKGTDQSSYDCECKVEITVGSQKSLHKVPLSDLSEPMNELIDNCVDQAKNRMYKLIDVRNLGFVTPLGISSPKIECKAAEDKSWYE